MTVQDWAVAILHLTRVVENDDLSVEIGDSGRGLVLGVRGNVTPFDVLDGHVLYVESNVVTW